MVLRRRGLLIKKRYFFLARNDVPTITSFDVDDDESRNVLFRVVWMERHPFHTCQELCSKNDDLHRNETQHSIQSSSPSPYHRHYIQRPQHHYE